MGIGRLLVATLLGAGAMGVGAQERPLPDQETFFAEVRKRLAGNDLRQSQFAFREQVTELKFNPFGHMGTGARLSFEVYPHPNEALTYRRLIARDGQPLSAEALADQDREYRRRLEDWQRLLAREGQSERETRERKAGEARARDAAQQREALDMFTFRIVGRETWQGDNAIVISFSARPGAQARSREGRIARVFAGKAWVHETEYEVMNVEAQAIEDVTIGYGMVARIHKGLTARFTRRPIKGEWLPSETRFEGTGRALMIRKVAIDFERIYDDYRPFDPAELPALLGWEP